MVIIIITLIVLGVINSNTLSDCETKPNQLCYEIQCPCNLLTNGNPSPPCFGYAQINLPNNQFICSSSPNSIVDASGSPI